MTDFSTITACGECCTMCPKKQDGRCPGCIESDGRVPEWADSGMCRVHACAKEHHAQFCGVCGEFPCEKLPALISWNPGIAEHMTVLRNEYAKHKETVEFLIKAKKATYAGKGAETAPSREKSHDLVYRDGDYTYYDTYLGGDKFAGEEALWISGIPFWSMNYIGRVTGDHFSGDFLKEALLHAPEDKPYRGPQDYTGGEYAYHCESDGSFDWFQGKETITYQGTLIYECRFQGGMIK